VVVVVRKSRANIEVDLDRLEVKISLIYSLVNIREEEEK